MDSKDNAMVEVRGFAQLKRIFDERGWSFPYLYKLEEECSAIELIKMLDLPIDKIEAVFINGSSTSLEEARVKPGDRVGYVPYGTPGVARLLLGIKQAPDEKK